MSEQLPQQYLKYNPNPLDQMAGHIGRISLQIRGTDESSPGYTGQDGAELHGLLDAYAARSQGNISLDPESEESKRLIDQLHRSPQFESPLFLPGGVRDQSDKILTIKARPDAPVTLPLRNFVYASEMKNWNKGRDGHKSGSSSRQIIRSYARQSTPMPPIGMVTAHVQPNGHVLYSSVMDGAHRVAAAHLRGDESIPVGDIVTVRRLSKNIIDPSRR